jgi:ligand-binding sensor domain-containing protein
VKTLGPRAGACALLFSLLCFFSCDSQEKTEVQEGSASMPVASAMEPGNPSDEATPLQQEPDLDEQISPFVRRIFQDRSGNLWFGTNGDGVCRYDGKSLDYYTIESGFGGRAVRAIVEDREGSLWFGTSGGVTRYEGEAFTNFTQEDGLSSDDVWCLCIDRAGNLWVGTWRGACRFDATSGRFTPFPMPPAPDLDPLRGVTSLNIVNSIMEDRAGNLWFSVGAGGVRRYDGSSLTSISEKDGLCNDSVNCILEDKDGDLWFATHHNGVCRYDGESFTNVMEAEGLSGTEVWDLYEDKAGNIWFPSEGFGVYRYDGQSFTNFSQKDGLASHAIQCAFEDREGRLWFGGWLGLYRYDGKSFVNVTKEGPWQ